MQILEPQWLKLNPHTHVFPLPNGVLIRSLMGGNVMQDIPPAMTMVFVPGLEIHEGKLQMIKPEREKLDLVLEVK